MRVKKWGFYNEYISIPSVITKEFLKVHTGKPDHRNLVTPSQDPRKTRTEDPCGTLEKPQNQDPEP